LKKLSKILGDRWNFLTPRANRVFDIFAVYDETWWIFLLGARGIEVPPSERKASISLFSAS